MRANNSIQTPSRSQGTNFSNTRRTTSLGTQLYMCGGVFCAVTALLPTQREGGVKQPVFPGEVAEPAPLSHLFTQKLCCWSLYLLPHYGHLEPWQVSKQWVLVQKEASLAAQQKESRNNDTPTSCSSLNHPLNGISHGMKYFANGTTVYKFTPILWV